MPTSLPRRSWLVVLTFTFGCAAPTAPVASESPTAAPTPSSAESTVAAFRAHLEEALPALDALLQQVTDLDQAQFPDIDAGMLGLAVLTWAADEQDWLRTNLPDDCYAEAWRAYDEAVDLVYAASGHLGDAMSGDTDFSIMLARDLFGEAEGLLSDLPADTC